MYLPSAFLFFCFLWSTLVSAWEPPTVYLIRHGEKPDDPKDPRLTKDGLKRAQCLRTVFGAESGYNISYIIAPKVKKRKSQIIPDTSGVYTLAGECLQYYCRISRSTICQDLNIWTIN